jgi:hypothetical protein
MMKVQIPIFDLWFVETKSITMKPTFKTFIFHIWWEQKQLECYNIPAVPFLLYSSETDHKQERWKQNRINKNYISLGNGRIAG